MPFLEDVDALKAALDKHRPIAAEKLAIIAEKLNIEWTYHSNAIEGNTLTLAETSFFLREGLTAEGKPLQDFLEARNHYEAIHFVEGCLQHEITESLIKEIHALVLRGIETIRIGSGPSAVTKPIHPGQYKRENNHVLLPDNSIHWYCDYLQVPGEMERLVSWYAQEKGKLHPVALAAEFHHRLVAIHPFADGNGRVTRLLMNLVLMQHQYPPAVIRNEDRREYYETLRLADDGDLTRFTEFVAESVASTLRLMLDVVEGRAGLTSADIRAKIDRLSRSDVTPEQTEAIAQVNQSYRQVTEHLRDVCSQLARPREAGRRFAVDPESYSSSPHTSEFQQVCQRQGFKLPPLLEAGYHPGLSLSFLEVAVPGWQIRFEVGATATQVLILRLSYEPDFQFDPQSFLQTSAQAPDRQAVTEFVLREVAAFVERASAALDRH